jgi:putative FmdB family regulatory protein
MIMRDFVCPKCTHVFEDLVGAADTTTPCPMCGTAALRQVSSPRIGLYNDPAAREVVLRKRSIDHTHKEVAKTPEKFGLKGRSSPWNIRSSPKSK